MASSSGASSRRDPIASVVAFLEGFAARNPGCSKDAIAQAAAQEFQLRRERSVYSRPEFALRFSTARGLGFSNVVLSLSALSTYDHTPFIICIVRPTGIELLLANASFLKKISHSSHRLSMDNVRGSFLGHDILRTFGGLANEPRNFTALFELHAQQTWEENLERLVLATSAIRPIGLLYSPSELESQRILSAPRLALTLSVHREYASLRAELTDLVNRSRDEILEAARIDNINLRGNTIEQIVTRSGNFHSVEDVARVLRMGTEVKIDIKTKLLNLASSPKGYNVDKTLKILSSGNAAVAYFLIGVDPLEERLSTCLVSIFDRTILEATRVQHHWAGRNSRGVTQLAGNLRALFAADFVELVDVARAQRFLQKLIDLRPSEARAR